MPSAANVPALRTSNRRRTPFWLLPPVILLALLASLPLFYVAAKAWDSGWHVAWQLLWRPFVFRLLGNTLSLMASVTLLTALLGLLCAWLVERSNLPGRRYWNVLLCLPFAIPSFVSSFTWISLSPIYEGFGGAVLIMTMSKYPLVYLPVAATLRSIDPSLEESARMLGLSRRQVFWRVTLPLLRPTLAATGLLVALHMLVEFGALSLLRFQTFTTAIYQEFELEFSNATAAMLSSVLLALCFGLLWLELRVRGGGRLVRTGQGSARQAERVHLRGWNLPVQGLLAALVVVGTGIPLAMLGYWLCTGSSAAFPLAEIFSTLTSSLTLSFGGALLGCLLALPVSILVVRHPGRLARWVQGLPYLLQAVPGLVIALSLVYFSLHYVPAVYQTTALLLVAYALLFLPLAQAPIRVALEKASPQLEEAARTLGQTPLMAFVRITLPIISPAIGAGFVLVFLDTMKELTATLVLGPTGLSTLATAVWIHTANLEYAAAAPYAALLILISGLPVYLLTTRAARSSR
ncbi:MAG: Sulfate transport system permease protein CysW [Pseudomonas citronellolis]|nr:MAG: Sulfate transport system permease protein CysW [Pseudomonas citronellolis]